MMDASEYIVIICIVCCLVTAALLWVDIRIALRRQQLALDGDADAAKHIILPCYKPFIRGVLVFNVLLAVAMALTFVHPVSEHSVVTYFCMLLQTLYLITPVMLMQTSVSYKAFLRTTLALIPFWAIGTFLFALTIMLRSNVAVSVCEYLFFSWTSVIPALLAIGQLTKIISSRIQVGSSSNRNSTELMLVFSLAFGGCYLAAKLAPTHTHAVDLILTSIAFCVNQLFPFALYRTLLADTKFWRGLGKHNQAGMDHGNVLRESGVNVHRPTMELHVINSTFQEMMSLINDITVDFAYLKLERLVGEGATAKVFLGTFKRKPVAVKLSTPPEITEEVMDVFVSEAKIAAIMKHKNIVEFVGICVRPPQICMVFEYCEGGNLKSHLYMHTEAWTPAQKISACLDASKAIATVHSLGFIHRDIKTENFFVGKDMVVKLGDFGESTPFRTVESTAENRMTIVGTVAYMAPELVAGARHYDDRVDIFALGVTFWEIWNVEEPYASMSTFDIYDHIRAGQRLSLPSDAPEAFNDILTACWLTDPAERISAVDLVSRLSSLLRVLQPAAEGESEAAVSSERSSFSFNPIFRASFSSKMGGSSSHRDSLMPRLFSKELTVEMSDMSSSSRRQSAILPVNSSKGLSDHHSSIPVHGSPAKMSEQDIEKNASELDVEKATI